jgi:hypothetical protein
MIGAVSLQVFNDIRQGRSPRGGWDGPKLTIYIVFLLGCLMAAFWNVRCQWRTVITQNYIYQPGLFRSKLIHWTEVTALEQQGYGFHIRTSDKRIVLALASYCNDARVISEIEKLVEAQQASAGLKHYEKNSSDNLKEERRTWQIPGWVWWAVIATILILRWLGIIPTQ